MTKLQAIEIIDDVNISFLEMRKAEKNYFLYQDQGSLDELLQIGRNRYDVLQASRSYLVSGLHGLSDQEYTSLLHNLRHYLELVQQALHNKQIPPQSEAEIRKLGHELTEQSATLLARERKTVSYIVSYNLIMLIVSLGIIFVIQVVLWQYFFRFIIQEIAIMEQMIKMVSEGRFHEVAVRTITPNNEIQVAVQAITDMARELEKREQELMQSGKLASLGILISGVAHELGNPLNNISLIAQTYMSLYDLLGDEDKKNYMEDVYTQSERIKKIVENLLDFSRQKKQELQDMPDRGPRAAQPGIGGQPAKNLQGQASRSPSPTICRRSRWTRPRSNRCWSTCSSMPFRPWKAGGELFIDASYDPEHDLVVLTVRDTGTGIKKEILPIYFRPVFYHQEHQRHRPGIVRELRHHPAASRGNLGGKRRGPGHHVYYQDTCQGQR